MIKKVLFIALVFSFCLSSCKKKEFSLSGEYEDVTILYGFLNPDDSVHYLKIYKSFLTDSNAYEAAKDIHNFSYFDSIEVTLEEYDGENLVRSLSFDTTTAIPKDSGLFAYPLQVLYKTEAILHKEYTYQVVIRNIYTRKIVKASTALVGDLSLKYPLYYPKVRNTITFIPKQQKLEYKLGDNVSYYQASFVLYYTEVMLNGDRRQPKPIVWDIGNSTTQFIYYVGETFLIKIKDGVKVDEQVDYRFVDSVLLNIYTASKDMYLYMLSTSASTGLNQERWEYTNVKSYEWEDGTLIENDNALGILSSRGLNVWMFDEFSDVTYDSLLNGRYTRHLKFKKYDY